MAQPSTPTATTTHLPDTRSASPSLSPQQAPSSPPPPQPRDPSDDPHLNSGHILLSRLRLHSLRLRIAKARAEFEQTLLTLLTLNVIYMYYVDHNLLVLVIRASQLLRLLYFPYASLNTQRNIALLLLVSNLPVLLIHKALFLGSGPATSNIGEMLFINFIGPEPKSLAKVIVVDSVTVALQLIILQCRCDPITFRLLSALPVPISEALVPLTEPSSPQTHNSAPQSSQDAEDPPANPRATTGT